MIFPDPHEWTLCYLWYRLPAHCLPSHVCYISLCMCRSRWWLCWRLYNIVRRDFNKRSSLYVLARFVLLTITFFIFFSSTEFKQLHTTNSNEQTDFECERKLRNPAVRTWLLFCCFISSNSLLPILLLRSVNPFGRENYSAVHHCHQCGFCSDFCSDFQWLKD